MKRFQKRAAAFTLAACLLFQSGMTASGAELSPETTAVPEATALPGTGAYAPARIWCGRILSD